MSLLLRIWRSSLGKKYIMAITGFFLVGFLMLHMAGNLLFFFGPENINQYGNFLQTTPELLWPFRFSLVAMVVLHFLSAAQLTLENWNSRPAGYTVYDVVAASYAARTMIYSGLIVFFFVVYHLLHYTFLVPGINLTGQDFHAFQYLEGAKEKHDIYRMMAVGFEKPIVSGFYMIGVGLLCAHLSHGLYSMVQSIGWRSDVYGNFLKKFAVVVAILLFLGFCSIPAAVLLGGIKYP